MPGQGAEGHSAGIRGPWLFDSDALLSFSTVFYSFSPLKQDFSSLSEPPASAGFFLYNYTLVPESLLALARSIYHISSIQ
jgi:hypothetical protein